MGYQNRIFDKRVWYSRVGSFGALCKASSWCRREAAGPIAFMHGVRFNFVYATGGRDGIENWLPAGYRFWSVGYVCGSSIVGVYFRS